MDKLMDNRWFIKGLALVLAVLLYSSIPHPGKKLTDVYVPGGEKTEEIAEFPVKAYYDTENLVISGIPDTVDITLKGPITHIQTAKALRNFEVYVDLRDAQIGRQKVKFKVRDLSDKIKATIKPEFVYVTVQEKVTKEFKVEAEFNRNQIADGYAAGEPVVEPNKVKITGAKSLIDRISYVKAAIEEGQKLKETISRSADIQVLDNNLNKLDVTVEPAAVKVTIPVKENNKKVPISVVQKGTPQAGVTIKKIELETREAVISANDDVLKNIDSVRVEVDVSKITDNTTLDLPVIISNGVIKVSPQMVKVKVTVSKEEEKTVTKVPITIRGLAENFEAEMDDPNNQMINILVNGPSSALRAIGPKDFDVFVDLSDLDEGSHEVNIHVEGPSDLDWRPDQSSAKITIKNNA
ncbi:CdaR family protein [Neobacillus kokaensis]|uniref:CdaA regulatory protein CdaR n=1 Tax=Neobacillus kokaensis TaxID=2759023 RepID=A0ABQ3NCA9_9BACI|nr:CdaR family protein [Neobacillus kokaensis]GHI01567.1 CdaA regulatory protein CdaR [Neobacillus kokaensis]